MSVAQQLYEGVELGKEGTVGLITYMRTDSTRISPVAQEEAKELYRRRNTEQPLRLKSRELYVRKTAMHRMRMKRFVQLLYLRDPESMKAFLSRDQFRLYKLVWERFVASQMSSAVLDTMTVDIRWVTAIFRA